ncbi:serine/threonine protein kinase RIO2, putative [Entamoeba histolytica HM-3:IMSS]|nr:serine/threonine protein kinase RIO2, putative [Entamoeba histolytica HM-3:IMSS]GAT97508.1 rio1 family protein [Entamoeba histolytica]
MVKLDPSFFRFMSKEEFRVLTAIEMGMRNHELVPLELIIQISKLNQSLVVRSMKDLHKHKLVWHSTMPYNGYRLTYLGYDYLALRTLTQRGVITGVAQKIGVGKEADIYLATNEKGDDLVLKFHRLGRTSFRAVKKKRDYTKGRVTTNWLYLSRLSAQKEFAFMKALYAKGFPTPIPVDCNRHCVLMSRVKGTLLANVREIEEPIAVFHQGLDLAVKLAECGLIHCDLNEFNLILSDDDKLTMIDFPQMVSVHCSEAEEFFDRDVGCIKTFFWKRFGFGTEEVITLKDIEQTENLDEEVKASGFDFKNEKLLEKARKEFVEDDSVDEEMKDSIDEDVNGNEENSYSDEHEQNEELE